MRAMYYNRNTHKSRKGFSLSELLLAMGLMAFVATVAIGGLVVIAHIRDTMNRQATANMIMVATVSYLRADLNDCSNPGSMDCTKEANAKKTPFVIVSRYSDFIVRKTETSTDTELATMNGPVTTYYWNSSPTNATLGGDNKKTPLYGIWVRVECSGYTLPAGWSASNITPWKGRSYLIAQNVMAGTGMYSRIKDGKINYDAQNNLYTFTIEVVDEKNPNDVILSQEVKICPDPIIPTFP